MSLLDRVPVIPVVVVDDPDHAVPLARALVAGGLPALELTLRTPVALEAMRRIAAEVPEILLGAGTVISAAQAQGAADAGAGFLVSPGSTPAVLDGMAATGLPHLAGVSTVSEVMLLLERGLTGMKLFPAVAVGGAPMLRAIAGPLPQARFCPTGGITAATAPDFLALPNVGCVGGTWLAPADALAARDWARIERLAADAAALGSSR